MLEGRGPSCNACACRAGQSSPAAGERSSHAPRLPAPKQHHQHAQTAVAAARRARRTAAAVTGARGQGSRFWGGGVKKYNREQIYMHSMLAFLCLFVVFFHLNCLQSSLLLNRAKSPAGLSEKGKNIYFGGAGRCGMLLNISKVWGAGWVRKGTRCSLFCRDFIKCTVIYGVHRRFWPALSMCHLGRWSCNELKLKIKDQLDSLIVKQCRSKQPITRLKWCKQCILVAERNTV